MEQVVTRGSYEKGKKVFEAAVNTVVKYIRDYQSGKLEDDLSWHRDISPAFKKYAQM